MRCKGILKISINQIILKKKIIISKKESTPSRFTMILSPKYHLIDTTCTLYINSDPSHLSAKIASTSQTL